jgi:membrane protease YdiL (CAAX protease family)
MREMVHESGTSPPLGAALYRFVAARTRISTRTIAGASTISAPSLKPGSAESYTARRLREFGPLGIIAVLVIFASSMAGFLVTAILVLIWAHYSHTPLRDLGFTPSRHPAAILPIGLASGILLKLAVKSVAMPLLGAPAINVPYHYLVGNAAALPWLVITVLLSASFGEEVFFRGYLFERLGKLMGTGRIALFGTILLSTALFALGHYRDQGIPGVEQASMTGLVLGGLYAWRKQIWLPMIVHAGYDLTAIAIIYFDWEEAVARLVFP